MKYEKPLIEIKSIDVFDIIKTSFTGDGTGDDEIELSSF